MDAIGLVIAAVGAAAVVIQLRARADRATTAHSALYAQSAELRGHLVEHPHLRRYFFDGAEITPGDADYDRVVTLAEIYLNCLEQVAVTIDSLGRTNRSSLERYIRGALAASPVLRRRLTEQPWSYSRALERYL